MRRNNQPREYLFCKNPSVLQFVIVRYRSNETAFRPLRKGLRKLATTNEDKYRASKVRIRKSCRHPSHCIFGIYHSCAAARCAFKKISPPHIRFDAPSHTCTPPSIRTKGARFATACYFAKCKAPSGRILAGGQKHIGRRCLSQAYFSQSRLNGRAKNKRRVRFSRVNESNKPRSASQ